MPAGSELAESRGSRALAVIRSTTLERMQGKRIPIVGRDGQTTTVTVGKLSLDQLYGVGCVLGDAVARLRGEAFTQVVNSAVRMGGLVNAAETGAIRGFLDDQNSLTNVVDIALDVLGPDRLGQLFAILCEQDEDWTRQNVGLEDMAAIISAVLEHNPPELIQRLFAQAARRLSQPKSAASSTETASPSPAPASPKQTSAGDPPNG